jgi:hypothetical protein
MPLGAYSGGMARLPSDPIGTTYVTFSGVHSGSEIRVFRPDGTEAAGIESCADDQMLTWGIYTSGSANNTVTVRIVNFLYKIKEFNFTSSVGSTMLPVQQEIDPWAVNPP